MNDQIRTAVAVVGGVTLAATLFIMGRGVVRCVNRVMDRRRRVVEAQVNLTNNHDTACSYFAILQANLVAAQGRVYEIASVESAVPNEWVAPWGLWTNTMGRPYIISFVLDGSRRPVMMTLKNDKTGPWVAGYEIDIKAGKVGRQLKVSETMEVLEHGLIHHAHSPD